MHKPSKEELLRAKNKSVPDVISKDLKIIFCGINPGLYTAAVQEHFGRPGNKFWKALHLSGFTPRLFHPSEQNKLPKLGIGITNLVNRATALASEVSKEEFVRGGELLTQKAVRYKPQWIAFVGIDAYRKAFAKPDAKVGKQIENVADSNVWLLPSTSGLNANYSLEKTAVLFKELNAAVKS